MAANDDVEAAPSATLEEASETTTSGDTNQAVAIPAPPVADVLDVVTKLRDIRVRRLRPSSLAK